MGTIHISPHERLKKYALKDIEQLYNDFHVKEGGLTQEQIEQMRKQHGSNHVGYSLQAHSFFQRIKRAFINPFSVILFVLAIVSFIEIQLRQKRDQCGHHFVYAYNQWDGTADPGTKSRPCRGYSHSAN